MIKDWLSVTISTICDIYTGNSINEKEKSEKFTGLLNGINYIGTKDVEFDQTINYENGVKIPEGISGFKIAPIGSTLLCIEGGSAGRKIGLTKQDVCFGNKLCAFVPYINSRFVFYFLQTEEFRKIFSFNKNGLIGGVSVNKLKEIEIPLPPLAEQGRIVEKIEALFSEIDAGVESLKNVKNQIKLYCQSVLKNAFDGKLYKTTEWASSSLKDICLVISDGDHQPPPKSKSGIPFIMISNLHKNSVDLEKTNFVPDSYYLNLLEKRKPRLNDILFSVVGSYGLVALVDFEKEFCFQRHIALLRPNVDEVLPKFLYYALRSNSVYKQATDCATGTAQKTVPLSGLREILIPLPTLDEQKRIVAEIEARFKRVDALETAVQNALDSAEKLKQSVLKKAFRGELVPQNPDDEPASVLLDRIRAERAAEQKHRKKGKQ